MAKKKSDTLQVKLSKIRKRYARDLPNMVREIHATWEFYLANDHNISSLKNLHRNVQSLAESSGAFNFNSVSNLAHTLEIYLISLFKNNLRPNDIQKKQISNILQSLQQAAKADPTSEEEKNRGDLSPDPHLPARSVRNIYLYDSDIGLGNSLAHQIKHFGYEVDYFSDLNLLRKNIELSPPAAAILEVSSPRGKFGGAEMAVELEKDNLLTFPLIFVSQEEDLEYRLQAVRAGGMAFLQKPIGLEELVDHLDNLTSQQKAEPYRILIVDDEQNTARQYASILEEAEMNALVLSNPEKILLSLSEFKPDLILMDMYMAINGLELTKLVRQHESFLSLPIVLLSTDSNLEKHMVAINMGIDDFLSKPVQPHHLIMTVRSRAQRSRKLRSYMIRDSLTGLFNHTTIIEKLGLEVARAKREGQHFSFAMLDLDNFKAINDTYGHLVGDRVIKNLSRLLMQRLRKTDIIGRYGGEEFAIILPGTSTHGACLVLGEIREAFANLVHSVGDRSFIVTFSCGVADSRYYSTAIEINDAADRALYQAKSKGKNQVLLASEIDQVKG